MQNMQKRFFEDMQRDFYDFRNFRLPEVSAPEKMDLEHRTPFKHEFHELDENNKGQVYSSSCTVREYTDKEGKPQKEQHIKKHAYVVDNEGNKIGNRTELINDSATDYMKHVNQRIYNDQCSEVVRERK